MAVKTARVNDPGVVMVGGMDPTEEVEIEVEQDGEGGGKTTKEPDKPGVVANVKLNDDERLQRDDELEEDARLAYDTSPEGYETQREGEPTRRQRRNAARRRLVDNKDKVISDLNGRVEELATQLHSLTRGQQTVTLATVENDLRSAQQALTLTDEELAKAVSAGDGARFREVQRLRDEASMRVFQLSNLRQRIATATTDRGGPSNGGVDENGRRMPQRDNGQSRGGQVAPELQPAAENFIDTFLSRYPYFDSNGGDEDSRLIKAIDDGVAADGYLPHTPMYWRTLEKRLSARGFYPESQGEQRQDGGDDGGDDNYRRPASRRTQNDSRPNRGRPPISSGRNRNGGGTSSFRLHPEMVAHLQNEFGQVDEKGLDDDQKAKRNRLISGWREGMKELNAGERR